MKIKNLPFNSVLDYTNQQVHLLEQGIDQAKFSIEEIGDLIPASVMIQELDHFNPAKVAYMNHWGCENLGCSPEEINEMGEVYYTRFFKEEELKSIIQGLRNHLTNNDTTPYSFFQQVKEYGNDHFNWYYTVCKLVRSKKEGDPKQYLSMISCSINGMGNLIEKVTKTLDQQDYISKNYKKFAALTRREKEIISLLSDGKSSSDIADLFFISKHTINTHRKNINRKLEIHSFAELIKFALAFELIK